MNDSPLLWTIVAKGKFTLPCSKLATVDLLDEGQQETSMSFISDWNIFVERNRSIIFVRIHVRRIYIS